ncbi:MAG: hypothetical protein KDA54_05845 [Phycisphaerales bacterium]|nr:hypothetical protein [Phycisphaerales bacterium]
MANWLDVNATKNQIRKLFKEKKESISHFGSKINQVFEAFVFCATIRWYEDQGWDVTIHNPVDKDTGQPSKVVRLKFSTRGKPSNYSYASCQKGDSIVEVRHQLRVATYAERGPYLNANICLDVAVIEPDEDGVQNFKSEHAAPNGWLMTFGEAKHMSAYAELIASFIGMVHELQPHRLKRVRRGNWNKDHPAPFLYVSGTLYATAKAIVKTIEQRRYDIDVYSETTELARGFSVSKKDPAPKKKKSKKRNSGRRKVKKRGTGNG